MHEQFDLNSEQLGLPIGQMALATTVRIMDKLHAEEVFGTPEQSKAYLDGMSFGEFQSFLNQVNGTVRGIPGTERGMNGRGAIEESNEIRGYKRTIYEPPVPSVRVELLQEAFEHAQKMDSPTKAGLMLGMVINAIHPYEDGNGRTSRMVFSMLRDGYSGMPNDQLHYTSLLANTSGREVITADPTHYYVDEMIAFYRTKAIAKEKGYGPDDSIPTHVYNGYGDTYVDARTIDDLQVSSSITAVGRQKLDKILNDQTFVVGNLMQILTKEQLQKYVKRVDDRKYINGDTLVGDLTEAQIDALYNECQKNKIAYVRSLIDVFDDPRYAKHMNKFVDKSKTEVA